MIISNRERRIGEYRSSQQILLVGEGDFSFSASLAKAFRSAKNMVATSLDSLDVLLRKHWSCQCHLDELEERYCLVLHEVDVHDMNRHPTLKDMKFDVIVFNFPHSGHVSWLCERDDILIERHKNLVRGFFRSACKLMNEGGEIHVAHRGDEPYNKWELEKLAQNAGLILKEKVPFYKEHYPGYHNKRGSVIQGNKKFPLEYSFTFKFPLPDHHHHHKRTASTTADEKTPYVPMVGPSNSSVTYDDHDDDRGDTDIADDETTRSNITTTTTTGTSTMSDDHDHTHQMTAGSTEVITLMISIADNSNVFDVHDNDEKITDDPIIDGVMKNDGEIAPTNNCTVTLTVSEYDHQHHQNRIDNDNYETALIVNDAICPVGDDVVDDGINNQHDEIKSTTDVVDEVSAMVEGFTFL